MGFEFYAEHELSVSPEYRSMLHELRDGAQQMLVIHMDVFKFSPSVMKRMIREFAALRSCTGAQIFAIEPSPDDAKWQRYVSHMGFEFLCRLECSDGLYRRCFLSERKRS